MSEVSVKSTHYVNSKGEQVDFVLFVETRPNLRNPNHEMQMYIGKSIVDNIFENKVVDEKTKNITIYYPDTWCNILELRQLTEWLLHFYPNLLKLRIYTHSVYIIQCVRSEHIRIIDDASLYPDGFCKDVMTWRACKPLNEIKNNFATLQTF